MFLQRKALYNLIQLNLHHVEIKDSLMSDLHPWQIENYRNLSTDELLIRLKSLNLNLTLEDFASLAHQFDSPEEMLESSCGQRDSLEKDQIFLLFFELWRRLFPGKRSISIFCDELDHQMICYDLAQPNAVGDQLAYLQQILDEHVDQGLKPYHAFGVIQTYCAVDLESFLFDYILNQIQLNQGSYAEELLDGFAHYMQETFWFKYLLARTEILKDPEEGYEFLEKIIRTMNEPHFPLLEEILVFLANTGNHSLFHLLAKKNLGFIKTEEEFRYFLETCLTHYSFLELDLPSKEISEILNRRQTIELHTPVSPKEKDMISIKAILDCPLTC